VIDEGSSCVSCGRDLGSGRRYRFVLGGEQAVLKCTGCAVRHPPLLRKAIATSLVVGTILVIINQVDLLLMNPVAPVLLWKVPLTYFVPFGGLELLGPGDQPRALVAQRVAASLCARLPNWILITKRHDSRRCSGQ
jgi:hypothetical protein